MLRPRLTTTVLAIAAIMLGGAVASAAALTLTNPEDYANPPADEYAPTAVTGTGTVTHDSWQADMSQAGLSQNWLYFQGDGVNHPQLLFDPNAGLTINDIASISWDTNKDKTAAADSADLKDWFITIYTLDANDQSPNGPWYNRRIQLRPWEYVDATAYAAGDWNRWYVGNSPAQGDGVPELETYVEDYTVGGSTNGTYTLADAKSLFGSDKLWFVALGTSFNNESGWGPGEFSSYVDNLVFDLGQAGGPVSLNLSAVPEPASCVLLIGAAVGALGLLRRRK